MISVIIPMYNCSKFIQQCLKSVLNQSYKDIEIIVVDDNSTDNSVSIVSPICKEDVRVKLILQEETLGAGAARNRALKSAKGDYILFLDSDDYISDVEALDILHKKTLTTDSDLVFFKHNLLNPATENINDMISHYERDLWEKIENNGNINKADLLLIPAYPWTKLFKRDFLVQNKINCTETYTHNDFALTLKSILSTNRISYLPERLVVHRHAPSFNQLTNDKSKKRLDLFKATADVNRFIEEKKIDLDLHSYYLQCKWDLFTWGTYRIALKYKPIYFKSIKEDLKRTPAKAWKLFRKQFPKSKKEIIKMKLILTTPRLYSLLYLLFSKEARNR